LEFSQIDKIFAITSKLFAIKMEPFFDLPSAYESDEKLRKLIKSKTESYKIAVRIFIGMLFLFLFLL
jgi:hypothetical protein